MVNDPPLFLSFSVSFRIPSNRFYSGFAISRTGFRHPYLFVCIETRLISISSFRRGSTCFLWGSKAMSTSNCTLSSRRRRHPRGPKGAHKPDLLVRPTHHVFSARLLRVLRVTAYSPRPPVQPVHPRPPPSAPAHPIWSCALRSSTPPTPIRSLQPPMSPL